MHRLLKGVLTVFIEKLKLRIYFLITKENLYCCNINGGKGSIKTNQLANCFRTLSQWFTASVHLFLSDAITTLKLLIPHSEPADLLEREREKKLWWKTLLPSPCFFACKIFTKKASVHLIYLIVKSIQINYEGLSMRSYHAHALQMSFQQQPLKSMLVVWIIYCSL